METILIVGRQILIMFLYMAIGFALYKGKLISREGSKSMAHLLLYCILPCVIVRSFCVSRTPGNTSALIWSIVLAAAMLAIAMLLSAVLFRHSPVDNFGAAFSNAGFMGFPLIAALLGSEAVFYAAGFVALLNALQWTYGQFVLTGDRKQISLKAIVKNPIIISLAIGLMIFFSGFKLPSIASDVVGALATLNAPIAMIVLGVYLAQTDLKKAIFTPRLYGVSMVRLVLIPVLTCLLLLLIPAQYKAIGLTLAIAAAAPIGSNVAVYAQKLNLDYTYAVETVCISTLLSIITMPVIVGVLQLVLI